MFINFFKRKIARDQKSRWDHQYKQGKWECLKDPLEEQRFGVTLEAVQSYAANGSILEVGCGEGILQSRMQPGSYSRYMGIDLSEVAIRRAAHLCNDHTDYQCADMETFTTESTFDVVLFNESLYYAKKPLVLFQRYARFLQPDGYMILSIYHTADNRLLLDKIEATYPLLEQKVTTNERGTWYCEVYAKKNIIHAAGFEP